MTVRRSLLLLASLGAAVALIASGCGGTSAAAPELTSFRQVADANAATGSARFALTLEASVPGAKKSFSFSAAGGFDTAAKRSQLTLDLSALADLLTSFGAGLGGTIKGDLPKDPDAWKLEAIQDGSTVYIRFPLIADQLPPGKTWVKGDVKELSSAAGGQLGQFGSFAGTDPRDAFGYLEAVSGKIEAVGGEKLRGVETSHYRATVDVKKLAELVPPGQRKGLEGFDQMIGQSGLAEIPVDVWIDAEQRVRKLVLDIGAAPPGSTEKVQASVELELYDYGTPLELQLPPAAQVVDAQSLKRPS